MFKIGRNHSSYPLHEFRISLEQAQAAIFISLPPWCTPKNELASEEIVAGWPAADRIVLRKIVEKLFIDLFYPLLLL